MAWIGFVDAATQLVNPVASYGEGLEYLRNIKISVLADETSGRGPVGTAIRENRPVWCNDFLHDPNTSPWHEGAARFGWASVAALPLLREGKPFGSLGLYSDRPFAFGQDMCRLLCEMAEDINFAFGNFAREEKRQATEEKNRQLAAIVEYSDDAIISKDTSGIITSWNQGAEKVYGYMEGEVLGKSVNLLVPPECGDEVPRFLELIKRDENIEHYETVRKRKDGVKINVSITISPLKDNEGNIIGASTIARDITEQKRAMELEVAMVAAEAANQAKSSFLATMSHEIRTPMNGVVGTVDVLRRTSLRPDQEELVEIIHDSAQGLLAIINDILDFSKIEAGKMELDFKPVALGELLESVCMGLMPVAEGKSVELVCFTDPRLPDWIHTDPVRVRQIVTNLVSNAIKFSSGQGRSPVVCVRTTRDSDYALTITVADNGIGMTREVLGNLFKPFTQADGSITRRFGGTGLGLSICKELVTMLDGALEVESTPGEGSIFRVALPCQAPETLPHSAERPDLSGLDCMVVSESDRTNEYWGAYLEHAGAQVASAQTFEDAATQLCSKRPSSVCVIVIDCLRRKVDGAAVQAAFSACPGRLHYVLVMAGSGDQVRQDAEGVFSMYGNIVRRDVLLRAAALAGGRPVPNAQVDDDVREGRLVAPSVEEARKKGRLILVAEDNEINQKVIRHQLATLGFACEIADNGAKALALCRSGKYALLISDLHMPVMDGYKLAEAIRREEAGGEHLPIIAFTANVSKGERGRCEKIGMDGYLTKPAPMDKLESTIHKWIPAAEHQDGPSSMRNTFSQEGAVEEAETSSAARVLDTSVLAALVGDDPALISDFLTDYLGSVSKASSEIQAAFAGEDWRAIGAVTHRLKSSSRSVGALDLADNCEQLEHSAKASDGDAVTRLMPEFEANVARAVNAIVDKWRSEP